MCVIFLYVNSNPAPNGYKLIIASNRDEFFARKTSNAHKWTNEYNVYGGTDMEEGREGGTWLAIGGGAGMIKVGALLNLTGEPKIPDAVELNVACPIANNRNIIRADALSSFSNNNNYSNNNNNNVYKYIYNSQKHDCSLLGRGHLVTNFVSNFEPHTNIESYNEKLLKECTQYNGFNLTNIQIDKGQPARISVCSNVPPAVKYFEEGQCLGFGNSLPHVPFEKVKFGRAQFAEILKEINTQDQSDHVGNEQLRSKLKDELMSLLKTREKHWPDVELQRRAPNWGEYLSSINVHIPHGGYGSRTHTVILVDAKDCLHFYESTLQGLDPLQDEWHDTYFQHPNFSQKQQQTKL